MLRKSVCSLRFFSSTVALPITGQNFSFHKSWLRINCHCQDCKEPSSGQRIFNPWNLQKDSVLLSWKERQSSIEFEWQDDQNKHAGVIPKDYLDETASQMMKVDNKDDLRARRPSPLKEEISQIDFSKYMNDDMCLVSALKILVDDGVVIISDSDNEHSTVRDVINRICPLMPTLYGEVFEVKYDPNPINVAYSNVFLENHMDLIYYESPPGLQALHCYRRDSSIKGGDSLLLDVFAVAEDFRVKHPDQFKALCEIPATFQKIHFNRESPAYMRYRRPHFVINHHKELTCVNWAPAFEGPLFSSDLNTIDRYYEAYNLFGRMLKESDLTIQFRLSPGNVLIFNNRRLLHGRTAFSQTNSVRHLFGAYANIDEFYRRYNALAVKYGLPVNYKRVGNQEST